MEKIQAIGRFVQNLQYISIDIGVGRGNGYRPQHALSANWPLLLRHRCTFESQEYGPTPHDDEDGEDGLFEGRKVYSDLTL